LALALHLPVGILQGLISPSEKADWKRFFQIFGPVGDRRLDEQFAYLRHSVFASQCEKPPSIDDLRIKYDYKRCFPKDVLSAVEEMVGNMEADIDVIMALGEKLKKAD